MGGKNKGPSLETLAQRNDNQNAANLAAQTEANRVNQYTPWGNTTWDNNNGKWTQTVNLSPAEQHALEQQQGIQSQRSDIAAQLVGRAGQEFGRPMDWGSLPAAGATPNSRYTMAGKDVGDPNAFRQRSQDAVYNMAKSRLDPQFSTKRAELETKLRNQGIGPEDAAYKAQMAALGNQETDAYNQANWSSVGAGRDESNAMFAQLMGRNQQNFGQNLAANQQNFGQDLTKSQYATQMRQQAMSEAMQKRGFSLNEINALLSGQQVQNPQMPSFVAAQSSQPSTIYQAGVDRLNANNAGGASNMSGITGLAQAGATFAGK